ncbi:MAG TPA: hypothetical protein ENJ38_01635 [Rhodospirillales bacterium]|nr:hypothetical protein [Rhodospirillales bacterium]
MPRTLTEAETRAAVEAFASCGTVAGAARALGLTRSALRNRLERAQAAGIAAASPAFDAPELPDPDPPVEEIIAARLREYERVHRARRARHLIPVRVRLDGPVAIAHFGDPHLDDPGCNLPLLMRHMEVVRRTEGMFAANVGDLQNNWVGRLVRLHAEQTTTARQAWRLVEWFVRELPWLYIVLGNHDCWAGTGDPLDWILRTAPGVSGRHGVRLALRFPNGREVRVHARHDFPGHSQWNPAHGPAKAAMMHWRDHILTCGHRHVSGYQIVKDPATGTISHAIRVASYKDQDGYAFEKGLPDGNFGPCAVTVIDPEAESEIGLVTVLWDVETAADFLTFLRRRRKA